MEPASLDATLSALADPTRRAILARLARGEANVTDLAAPFAIESAVDFETPQSAGARGADLAGTVPAISTVPPRSRAAEAGCRLGRRIPALLGRQL